MPKQISPVVKLRGTIDQLNFYKSQDGYMVREKGGVDAERIKNDPRFRLTRLNGLEFGIGGRAGKLFRSAWKTEIGKAADNRMVSRITQAMVSILQTDTVNDYGFRKVENGDVSQLNLFEFNIEVPLSAACSVPFAVAIDRPTGQAIVSLPAYTPQEDIVAPEGTTHYSIFAAAAAINFADDVATASRESTANLLYGTAPVTASTLTLTFPADSPFPVFLLLGIEFMKIVNGKVYSQSKGLSALQIVAVDMPTP